MGGNRGILKGGNYKPVKRQMTPKEAAEKKPKIKNPDGSTSSERTITVGRGKEFINIPTIREGKQLSHKVAVEAAKKENMLRPSFSSIKRAVKSAGFRSHKLGQEGKRAEKRKKN